MTEKQKRFADEYLIDLNATRAYKTAYPNIKSSEVAKAAGSRLLANVNLKEYINQQIKIISDGKVAKAQEVMEYLTSVLRGESQSEIVVVEGCGDGCSEARRINKLPDEKERLKAAELLGKRYGMFTDKLQIEDSSLTIEIKGEFDEC